MTDAPVVDSWLNIDLAKPGTVSGVLAADRERGSSPSHLRPRSTLTSNPAPLTFCSHNSSAGHVTSFYSLAYSPDRSSIIRVPDAIPSWTSQRTHW